TGRKRLRSDVRHDYFRSHPITSSGEFLSSARRKLPGCPAALYADSSHWAEPVPLQLCSNSSCGAHNDDSIGNPPYFRAPGSIISSSKDATFSKVKLFMSAAVRPMLLPESALARTTQGPALPKPTMCTFRD